MQAMGFSLPEEILSEILSYGLEVPDYMFSDIAATSPFAGFSVSSSAILLVNKTWLRVATPLLYNTVVIRSRAQASALATALEGKHRDNFGRFVRKLRVEGGFGKQMLHVLEQTPHVTDLFLTATMRASDNVSGLVAGLPLLNPSRLILCDERKGLVNHCVRDLCDAVREGIEKWTNLTSVTFCDRVGLGILVSKTLKVFSLIRWERLGTRDYTFLEEVAQIPSLEAIELDVRTREGAFHETFIFDFKRATPRLQSLVKVVGCHAKEIASEADDTPVPLPDNIGISSLVPQSVADNVWERIVGLAMAVEYQEPCHEKGKWTEATNLNRLNIALVSKTFKELALPYLYGYPVFTEKSSLQCFSDRLCADSTLGLYIREMRIKRKKRFRVHPNLIPILCRAPRLTRLIGDDISMTLDAFNVLAETTGQTLVEFTGFCIKSNRQIQPAVFDNLSALQSLEWDADDAVIPDEIQSLSMKSALPSLRFLDVASSGLLPGLSRMQLPAIRHVVLRPDVPDYPAFLSNHEDKITRLGISDVFNTPGGTSIFYLIPALSHLDLDWTCVKTKDRDERGRPEIPHIPVFDFPSKHHALTKLVVRKLVQGKSLTTDLEEWRRFLEAAVWDDFPGLREVQILYEHFTWPTNPYAISKSLWVKWAERLSEREIRLTDSEGVQWRPRCKVSRRR
ncbi:hypothetical protein C8R47DRAFT_306887 [Mycena vitilis]|nr:hypothetical protein C8R47DRAFT_306887 [Mycena vitilis]